VGSAVLGAVLVCGGAPDVVAPGCSVLVPRGSTDTVATVIDTDDTALHALVDSGDGSAPWLVHMSDVVPLSTAVFSAPLARLASGAGEWCATASALQPVYGQVLAGAEAVLGSVAGRTTAGPLCTPVAVALAVLTASAPEVSHPSPRPTPSCPPVRSCTPHPHRDTQSTPGAVGPHGPPCVLVSFCPPPPPTPPSSPPPRVPNPFSITRTGCSSRRCFGTKAGCWRRCTRCPAQRPLVLTMTSRA
jgi:hypothetical protein